jgi:hypothetical protein
LTRRLSTIAATDQLHGYAFVVLGLEIAQRLGIGVTTLVALAVVHRVGFLLVGRRVHRAEPVRAGALARAVALVVGAVPTVATVGVGVAAHGATAAASPANANRLAARLGNVAAPLAVGALALWLEWPAVFVVLAVLSAGVAAYGFRPDTPRSQRGESGQKPDDLDDVMRRFVTAPGGRVAMTTIAVAAVTEFPIHVVAFVHLGALGMPVWGRALVAGGAELIGVLANLAVSRRTHVAAPRSPQVFATAVFVATTSGLALLVTAVRADSLVTSVLAMCIGSIGISAVIPFLALGTRAVLSGAIGPRLPLAGAGGLAAALLLSGSAVGAISVLVVLPAVATVVTVGTAFRWPSSVATVLDGVANVTVESRISSAPAALD